VVSCGPSGRMDRARANVLDVGTSEPDGPEDDDQCRNSEHQTSTVTRRWPVDAEPVTDLHLPDDSCCAEPVGARGTDDPCPGCGAVDPMGDEDAWHADGCPVIALDALIGTWLDPMDADPIPGASETWALHPHVTCLGGNVLGIEGALADEYATRVLVTVADREPIAGHPGAEPHPGYTVTVCQHADDDRHDHADDPDATVDTAADLRAAITRLR
jgi:hypothetical protein